MSHPTFISLAVTLLVLLPFTARSDTENGIAPSRPASIEPWVGPGTLVHSNEKHQRCESGQFELFSCGLQLGGFAAVCLSPTDLHTTEFEFQDKNGHDKKNPLDNLEVGFQGGSAHAYNMILRGREDSTVTTIFVSEGTYDGESGAISQATDGHDSMSYCISENIYVPALWVKDRNGHERPVDKDSLIDQGIAKPLTDMPEWPEIPYGSLPQKSK